MLKIRLQREGRKNDPAYRVVVTEHTNGSHSQKHVDRVGFYHPKTKDQHLDADRITHWLSVGAKASDTVHNMLVKAGIVKADTINVLPKKTPIVAEKPAESPSAQAAESKEEAPVVEDPVEAPAEEAAVATEEAPAEETPVEEAPATEDTPAEEVAVEEDAPSEAVAKDEKPAA